MSYSSCPANKIAIYGSQKKTAFGLNLIEPDFPQKDFWKKMIRICFFAFIVLFYLRCLFNFSQNTFIIPLKFVYLWLIYMQNDSFWFVHKFSTLYLHDFLRCKEQDCYMRRNRSLLIVYIFLNHFRESKKGKSLSLIFVSEFRN